MVRKLLFVITILLSGIIYSQTDTEFWFAVPEVSYGHRPQDGEPTYLHLSALDVDAVVTISMPQQPLFTPIDVFVPAKTTQKVDLTGYIRTAYIPGVDNGSANQSNILELGLPGDYGKPTKKGVLVESSSYITAYLERNNPYNTDIWALKGKTAYGDDFYAPSQTTDENGNYTPMPLYSIDIVAVEDAEVYFLPPAGKVVKGYGSGLKKVTLKRGETLCLVADTLTVGAHLGGTRVWTTGGKNIVVQWKDDSVKGNNCRDLIGDQLVPTKVAGNEYVVMRGQLGSPDGVNSNRTEEYVYIMSLKAGVEIEFNIVKPAASTAVTPANITTGAPGTIQKIQLNELNKNIDALHMKSIGEETFSVFHVAGFGCEKGAAILPSIKGCTGSTEVSFTRSTGESFFLNIMTKEKFIDDFLVYIDGQAAPIPIPKTWFTRIPGTGMDPALGLDSTEWYFLDKAYNEFTNAHGPFPAIPVNKVTKVVNTEGLFHLALINGGPSSGCRYGYFSDFNDNLGEAVIGGEKTDFLFYCYGDTVQLQARGGVKYRWENVNTNPPYPNTFIDPTTLSTPRVTPPVGQMFYQATITRACYPELLKRDTVIKVSAIGYPEIKAVLDTVMLTPSCCSPVTIDINNKSKGSNQYEWEIIEYNKTTTSTLADPGVFTFTNKTNSTKDVTLVLNSSFTYNCPDIDTLVMPVHPEIGAMASKGAKTGCRQDITQDFYATGSSGPYTTGIWDWGDGTGQESFDAADSTDTFTHSFSNLTNFDTIYNVYLIVLDSLTGCTDTSKIIPVEVPGVARARYAINNKKGCSPLDVTITNLSNGIVDYNWWFRTGNNSSGTPVDYNAYLSDTTLTYTNTTNAPLEYYVFLIIDKTNDDGSHCYDTCGVDTITVYPEFNVTIDQGNQQGCNPYTATFTSTLNNPLPNMTYYWNFGDGTSSGVADPGSKKYSHLKPTDQTYTARVIATSEYECTDTSPTRNVDVYAFVGANFTVAPDTFGCAPLVVTITNNTSVNSAKNFAWNLGVGATGVPSNAVPFNVTYDNNNSANTNPVITLTNGNGHAGCDKSFTKRLTVKPLIVADIQLNDNIICHGDSIQYINLSEFVNGTDIRGAMATYEWNFGDGTLSSTETGWHKYVNTDLVQKVFTITLTITVDGCTDTQTATVTVLPEMKPQFTADSYTLCTPITVNIKNTSIGASSYTWRFTSGTTYNTTNITHTFTNPPNSNTINTQTLTLTARNGQCERTISKQFTIYPELNPQFTPSVNAGCEPLAVTFTNSSTGGALSSLVVEWDWNDGTTEINSSNSLNHNFINKTPLDVVRNVELKITNAIGCSDSVTLPVNVYAHVDSKFTVQDTTGCSPFIANLKNNTSANSAKNFVWNFNGGTGVANNTLPFTVQYVNQGSANFTPTIILTNGNNHAGCEKTYSKTITVKPEITPQFAVDKSLICHADYIQFTNTSIYKNNTAIHSSAKTQFSWNFGDGATSNVENPSHQFLNTQNNNTTPQSFTVTLTLTVDGCTETYSSVVSVYPKVTAAIESDEYIFCAPETEPIRNISTGAASYLWQFSDAADFPTNNKNAVNKAFDNLTAENINNVTVTLTATNDFCKNTTSKVYQVYPRVVVSFTQDVTEGCNPLDVKFTNNSTGRLSYVWDFNDGQSSADKSPAHRFSHVKNSDKVFTAKLVVEQEVTGCKDSATVPITVYSYVNAKFGLTKAGFSKGSLASGEIVGGCTPFNVVITDSSVTNGTWEWIFGEGTTGSYTYPNKPAPISKTYVNGSNDNPLVNKDYTITLEVTNLHGCNSKDTRNLEVYPRTNPDFNAIYGGCSPHPVTFDNITVDDRNTSYFWEYGDGASSNERNPYYLFNNYSYTNDTVYTVKLTATTQYRCVDDTSKTITVYPKPLARIVPDISKGCAPLAVNFTDASIAKSGYSLMWNLDDGNGFIYPGTVGGSLNYVYQNRNNSEKINTYDIELAVETNSILPCRDTVVYSVHAYPEVDVDFSLNEAGCSPHTVNFNNLCNNAVGLYSWDFGYSGESSVIKNPVFTYHNRTGSIENYTVYLKGSSKYGCSKDTTHKVTVYPSPKAYFDITEPWQIYPDTVYTITNLSDVGDYNYYWTIGDGTPEFSEQAKSFDIRYTGWAPNALDNTYYVTLRVDGTHCDTAKTHKLRLLPPDPEITIMNPEPNGCVPLTVNFDASSRYGNSYVWEFADGTTSTEFEPVHTFTKDGIYNVKVTVSGDGGERYDYIAVVVHPLPVVDYRFEPEYVMLPDQRVQFYNLTENGKSYVWYFGDGSISNLVSPSYQYTKEGFYDIMLKAISEKGCVDSLIHGTQIQVSGAGNITFPNTFIASDDSPANGAYEFPDVKNDVFHPHYSQVMEYNLYVYNRWGEQVFTTTNIREGWNGRYSNTGQPLSQGVYFWKATGKYYNGNAFKLAGDVTLIRK